MKLPKKIIIDTNVPINANLANTPDKIPDNMVDCVYNCVAAIQHVITEKGLVIDSGGEIFKEYMHKLSLTGQNGLGNAFVKWVYDHQWSIPDSNRVEITKEGDSYKEFPNHDGLINFDISDRKFIAVANAHPEKPPILQSTNCKWWGWKDALKEVGVSVYFLCPEYVKEKYKEKIGL